MGKILEVLLITVLAVGVLAGLGSFTSGLSNEFGVTYDDSPASQLTNRTLMKLNSTTLQIQENLNSTTPGSDVDISFGLLTGAINAMLTSIGFLDIIIDLFTGLLSPAFLAGFGIPAWVPQIILLTLLLFIIVNLVNSIKANQPI